MADLLSGLGQFGLGNLENMNLYEEPKKEEEKVEAKAVHVVKEEEYLFDKSFKCPVCNKDFKARSVRSSKVRVKGTDMDLRPKYDQVDASKYDVIMCPNCGYTALSRFFNSVTDGQVKSIKEKISASFKKQENANEIYTYEEALERYKLALANAIVKQAKSSEKAYICLKTAWLLRGQLESLDTSDPEYEKRKNEIEKEENDFLNNALEGFLSARQTEDYPMCGMDENTVDYLIAVTAMRFEQYDVANRLLSEIIVSRTANPRTKDKARDVKEILVQKVKEKNAAKK